MPSDRLTPKDWLAQQPLQTGERIYIKRGLLGAFYLGKDGSNRTLKVVRSN